MQKNTKSNNKDININQKTEKNNIAQEKSPTLLTKILKDVGKQVLKAIRLYTTIFIGFGLGNLIFLAIWLTETHNFSDSFGYICLFIISLIIGICSIVAAIILTHRFLLINTIQIIYKYLEPFFRKLSTTIIDVIISQGNKVTGTNIQESININNLLIEIYGQKFPKLIQKSLSFVIMKIPFGDFIVKMHNDFKDKKDDRELSSILYNYLNTYILQSIFGSVSMKWIYCLFPLNVLIQIILLIIR